MRQNTFAAASFERYRKPTRRELFLAQMDEIIPWRELCVVIEPFYPKGDGAGRPPVGVERMLRIHFIQHWFNLSDPAVEEALYDSRALRNFVGVDLGQEPAPDETTICKFRHLLEAHNLGRRLFELINEYLEDKYPEKPLLPKDAEGRAKVRSFTRHHDLYLEPPMRALFPQLAANPRDSKLVEEKLADITNRLDQVEAALSNGPWATGNMLTLADAALTPTIFFMVNFLPAFGAKGPFEGRPKLAAWWGHIQERPTTKKVLGEQQVALNAMMKK